MILYLIFLGVSILLFVIGGIWWKKDWHSDAPSILLTIGTVFGIITIILTVIIIGVHARPQYKIEKWNLKREAIVWQMENGYMSGDLAEYNEDVFSEQKNLNNPWFSWFHGDWVMELELIDVDSFK